MICTVSDLNNVKLEMSASKSLLLKKRAEAGKETECKLHMEEILSFIMSKQELI